MVLYCNSVTMKDGSSGKVTRLNGFRIRKKEKLAGSIEVVDFSGGYLALAAPGS